MSSEISAGRLAGQPRDALGRASVAACDRALRALLNAQHPDGWWTDFLLAPGPSDEWVTGYVGTCLAALPDSRALDAARDAWRLLQRRRHLADAWAYNALPPGDADSTTWGLRLADALGALETVRAREAAEALARHLRPGGGVATYAEDGPIRRFIGAPAERSFRGWCGAHPCVSAAASALPQFRPLVLPYMRALQRADGAWNAYWWHDNVYTTALAVETLARVDDPGDRARLDAAARWACAQLGTDGAVATVRDPAGSPFATALCLRVLLAGGIDGTIHAAARAAIAWLLSHQQSDGRWQPSARMRLPMPDDEWPDDYTGWVEGGRIEGSSIVDRQGLFTTATVLTALRATCDTNGNAP